MRKLILISALIFCGSFASAQCSSTAYGAYTCVSTAYNFSTSVTSRNFTVSVTTGQIVIIAVWDSSSTATLGISAWGACGNLTTYGGSTGITNATTIVGSAVALRTGQCALVVTSSVSSTIAARTWIWSGAGSKDTAGNSTNVTVTSGVTANCPTVTTTINGDLVFCALVDAGNNGGNWTAGTGFTGVTITGVTVGGEAEVQTSAGAITPQFKYSASVHVGATTVTLSTQAIPTLSTIDGITVGSGIGQIETRNGQFINPAAGYVNKLYGLTTPFTALPVATFMDFSGGTNGNVPASADLTSGTHGALFSYVTVSYGSGMTYTNTFSPGNIPQPVVAGSNVYRANGSLGLLCTTTNVDVAANICGSSLQQFTWTSSSSSAGYWYQPSCPAFGGTTATDCGALGILTGGTDYVNAHVNGIGGNCSFNGIFLEGKGGNSSDCLPYTNNTLYRINGQINKGQTAFTATFTNGSASITATQTLAANQAVKFTTTGALPTNFNLQISTGTYTSGVSTTGSIGQYCNLGSFNGGGSGATGRIYLDGTNSITTGRGITWTALGTGYTSAPTSATASSGTATCSGTAVISTVLATPILFVSATGLSGSAFQVSSVQGGASISAGSVGSGTHTVTVYDILTICTGNPPVFLGTLFAPAFTTPSAPNAVQIGISGEGPQVNGDTFLFGGYTLDINGDISLTKCIL